MTEQAARSLAQKSIDIFAPVREAEHAAITERRKAQEEPRPDIAAIEPPYHGAPGPEVYNLAGLSLSGGGIRSASFCLGALQALDEFWGLKSVDYLSTVSGGGYIGSALTASTAAIAEKLRKTGVFAFAAPDDHSDSAAIGHLRNYSNYLLPRGESFSFLRSLSVVLRGLFANLCLVLVTILGAAFVLLWSYPSRETLVEGSFLIRLLRADIWQHPFALTGAVALLVAFFCIGWALWRSFVIARGCDATGLAVNTLTGLLIVLLIVAFLDLQPVAIAGLFDLRDAIRASNGFLPWIKSLAVALAPFGAAVAFFANRLGGFLESTQRARGAPVLTARIFARLALLLGATAIPLALWLTFLLLCMMGIEDDGGYLFGVFDSTGHFGLYGYGLPVLACYAAGFAVLLAITFWFAPNANSLHRLYRDRLSKAFLFDPSLEPQSGKDFPWLDDFALAAMSPAKGGPYQLVNAALNIQASKIANRRGRNADFFVFSSRYVGSDSTGYVKTEEICNPASHLDLATAMAISGAAASADMGSKSIAPLAPTLALLNIRLGYWMDNPKFVGKERTFRQRISDFSKFYLLLEMFGQLTEDHRKIYLTDGGHIENLGIYQLLKRGCRFIVAVDAEADPEMGFPSLIDLQRYARIDLGIQIELPWQEIAATSKKVNAAVEAGTDIQREFGPHVALGTIHYPNGVDGYLLYIKSSLSGDENDYILDYKRRYPDFPHETTSDQFFTEEQFEVYRALGFHAVASAFQDEAGISYRGDTAPVVPASADASQTSSLRAQVMSPAYLKLREIIEELQ